MRARMERSEDERGASVEGKEVRKAQRSTHAVEWEAWDVARCRNFLV